MVVLNPLKVVITNLEAGLVMELDAKKWPDAQSDDTSSFYKVTKHVKQCMCVD
nr:Glutamine--tRNA ligase [Ipomoea batatas]GMD19914.1 Glutamine--tRNA ligase [Ipomoea batatas]